MNLSESSHDAVRNCRSTSGWIALIFLRNNNKHTSMINVIKYGGFPNLRTVAISAALIVYECKKSCKMYSKSV